MKGPPPPLPLPRGLFSLSYFDISKRGKKQNKTKNSHLKQLFVSDRERERARAYGTQEIGKGGKKRIIYIQLLLLVNFVARNCCCCCCFFYDCKYLKLHKI